MIGAVLGIGDPSDADIARALEVQPQSITGYKEKDYIPADTMTAFCLANKASVDSFLTGSSPELAHKPGKTTHSPGDEENGLGEELARQFVFVPRFDIRAVGGQGEIVQHEQVLDVLAYRADYIKGELGVSAENLAVISASGNSMEPLIHAGDSLLVNLADKKLTSDGVYIINYDGGLLVKRVEVRLDSEMIVLKSDNKAEYGPQEITPERAEQLTVVGKVVLVSKRV